MIAAIKCARVPCSRSAKTFAMLVTTSILCQGQRQEVYRSIEKRSCSAKGTTYSS
jgi:hypothetical protein